MIKKIAIKYYMWSVSKKKDMEMFWMENFKFLMGDQITAILNLIDKEIEKSFLFGLKLRRDHVIREKTAVLVVLNKMGNLHLIPKTIEFEFAMRFFLEALYEVLEEENGYYFKKCEEEGGVKTKYNCHLQFVASEIMHSIYNKNGKIPYI